MKEIFQRKRREQGSEAFEVSPFHRLARAHGLSIAGDALLTIALADSLFFDVDPNGARSNVAVYLLCTIAPFAVVAPLLGPAMDAMRGGHRIMIIVSALVRACLMVAMVKYVQTPLLYPLAFSMLVMGKTYAVAKSAVVPTTVDDPEILVKYNSRLSILSALSGAAAGIPGVLLLKFGGAQWVLGLGAIVFFFAVYFAFKIPAVRVASKAIDKQEKVELKSSTIRLAASAMGFLRGVSGFVTMLLAFSLRGGIDLGPEGPGVEIGHRIRESLGLLRLDLTSGGAPPWHFGVALIGVGLGGIIGSGGVPKLRSFIKEEYIIAVSLISLAGLAGVAALSGDLLGAFVMGFTVSLVVQGGRQAFDSIVQRDAPQANLGRTFSKFESKFQLVWVLGALLPVAFTMPARLGYIFVAAGAVVVCVLYWLGRSVAPAPAPSPARTVQRTDASPKDKRGESVFGFKGDNSYRDLSEEKSRGGDTKEFPRR